MRDSGPHHDLAREEAADGPPAEGLRSAGAPATAARQGGDPVKALLHRHRALCERAVDPLEIAAALEAHGVTDRTAARFRHRDVFSLAEELYARTPRSDDEHLAHQRSAGTEHPGRGSDGDRPTSGRPTPGTGTRPLRGDRSPGADGARPADRPPMRGLRGAAGVRGAAADLAREDGTGRPVPAEEIARRAGRPLVWAPLALLPGAAVGLTLAGLAATSGPARFAVGAAGTAAAVGALAGSLRHGPLRAARRTHAAGPVLVRALSAVRTPLWCTLLLGCLLLDAVPDHDPGRTWGLAALTAEPDRTGVPLHLLSVGASATLLALALAVAPALWCAHLFFVRARRALAASRRLADFAAGARPLLLGAVALFAVLLGALVAITGTVLGDAPRGTVLVGCLALGTLFFLARLLTAHGFARTAGSALFATCAARTFVLAAEQAARVPRLGWLDTPTRAAADLCGPGAVTALVCGAAALALLVRACALLTRASAHAVDWPAPAHAGG
ncbi:hypothetical protein [Streptomyces sp. NPDC046887]|uniref:hypothetical protein n=1 Tax=Streptomyces sp. NPDC046887 TaxID=3155472 RepID=UPI0033C48C1E